MSVGDKRRTDARRGRQGQRSGRGKAKSEAAPGRASQPMIVYWDYDAVGGDGSSEEVYEIEVPHSDVRIQSKRERKQR
jgi:hypothetical protein